VLLCFRLHARVPLLAEQDPDWTGFGLNANLSRLAVGEISPMLLVVLRWIATVALLLVIVRRRLPTAWPTLRARWLFLLLMGTLGLTSFNALFYVAGHSTTALNIGIIQGSIPVFVLAGAAFLYRTPVRVLQGIGIVATLAGVVIVTTQGVWENLSSLVFRRGDLLMLVACALYAGYSLSLRRAPGVDHLVLLTGFAAGALVASIPLVIAEAALGEVLWPTAAGWLIVVVVTLFPSFIAQVCYIKGVAIIGAGRAGIFLNLVPVFAAMMAVAFLGEVFALHHAVAMGLVLGGIGLSELGRPVSR
jgi:drug/metabolite transporter (DMT)-like permease